jgi:predicted GNAT family acetyltransferase
MDVENLPDAQSFLDATAEMRGRFPLHTNVMGSVAGGVATGLRTYDSPFWWVVRDQGAVVAMAMRTAPFSLAVSPMDDAAATALGRAVVAADPGNPGVFGPASVVAAVCAAVRAVGDDRPVTEGRRDVLYEVETLRAPTVKGSWRIAGERDYSLVLAWIRLFHLDVADPAIDTQGAMSRLRADSMYLWEVDGTPVSLAGHAPPAESEGVVVSRVGPVYTPTEQRNHGYAAAVTAAVTARLLASGARVMLHADAANPTSNGVYQRLGYVARDEMVHVNFGEHS